MVTETMKIGKHYQLPLPFKNSTLSNNRKLAEKRLISLMNRCLRDPKYWSDYKLFIQDLLTKVYVRKSAGARAEGKCWYIPHHGVKIAISQKSESCLIVVPNTMTGH